MRAFKAGFAYFAIVFGTGFILGLIRVPLLVPRLGTRAAELLEMPFMFVAILFSARFVARRFALTPRARTRLSAGAIALALMVAAELGLAVLISGQSIGGYIASRDPVSGSVYLAMLAVFALMPMFVAGREGDPPYSERDSR